MGNLKIIDGWVREPLHDEHQFVKRDIKQVNWGEQLVGIPTAWQQTQGEDVRVFVLDTGIDYNHPDLKDAFKYGFNITNNPHTNDPADRDGHGTHVCGIIAANGQVSGVAPKASLFMAKILGDSGNGETSWIIDACKYAMRNNVDIVSMSLGTHTQPEPAVLEALRALDAAGTVIVCAAGNERKSYAGDSVGWPAKYVEQLPNLIVVAAIDENSGSAYYSSQGPEVTIAAPGTNIYSTYPGNRYQKMSGTSMATPFVSGTIALALAKNRKELSLSKGTLSPKAVKELLTTHSKQTNGIVGRNDQFGFGIIDISFVQSARVKE